MFEIVVPAGKTFLRLFLQCPDVLVARSHRHKTFKQRGGLRQTGARRRHQRLNVIRRIAKCRQSARFVQRGTGL